MELKRLIELAGVSSVKQLNELDGYDVKHNKDTISSLRKKLKGAGVNISNMSDDMVLKFANKMSEITIESLKTKKAIKESDEYSILDKFEMTLTDAGFDVVVNGDIVELEYHGESLTLMIK